MAFKRSGDEVLGYRLMEPPQLSGQSRWAFAQRGREEVFIKQFLQPKMPSPGDPGTPKVIAKRSADAKAFEEKQNRLQRLVTTGTIAPSLVVPFVSQWVGGDFTKIFPRIKVHGANLSDISSLPNEKKAFLMLQVAEALQSLHHRSIVHSDIKWSNILFTKQSETIAPRLIDFDGGYHLDDRPVDPDDVTFDAPYGSPELLRFVKTAKSLDGEKVGLHSDIFSLGVLFHEMAEGVKPLGDSTTPYGQYLSIYDAKIRVSRSSVFYDLCSTMLARECEGRPKIDSVISRLAALVCKDVAVPAALDEFLRRERSSFRGVAHSARKLPVIGDTFWGRLKGTLFGHAHRPGEGFVSRLRGLLNGTTDMPSGTASSSLKGADIKFTSNLIEAQKVELKINFPDRRERSRVLIKQNLDSDKKESDPPKVRIRTNI